MNTIDEFVKRQEELAEISCICHGQDPFPMETHGTGTPDFSSGMRIGRLTKFSYKGTQYKSWEGILDMGGNVSDGNGGSRANLWEFSVLDANVASQIEKAAMSMQPVALHYKQYGGFHPINISTSYLVDGVSIAGAR